MTATAIQPVPQVLIPDGRDIERTYCVEAAELNGDDHAWNLKRVDTDYERRVAVRVEKWRCSCQDYLYRHAKAGTHCKHIQRMREWIMSELAGQSREIAVKLAEPFPEGVVKIRPGSVSKDGHQATALSYVDSRSVADRLDAVVGVANWQDTYETIEGGCVICHLTLRINGEWITKVDVGGQSKQPDAKDKVKASFSDAFKRAAVKWGVGRYLYRLPQRWLPYDSQRKRFVQPPKSVQQPTQKPAEKPSNGQRADETSVPGDWLIKRLRTMSEDMIRDGVAQKGNLYAHIRDEAKMAHIETPMAEWAEQSCRAALQRAERFVLMARVRWMEARFQEISGGGWTALFTALGINPMSPEDVANQHWVKAKAIILESVAKENLALTAGGAA